MSTVSAVEQTQVVVRRPINSSEPVRVGAVLSRGEGNPIRYRVRWEDGEEEQGIGPDARTSLAVRGSLRHLYLVDQPSLARLFAADPAAIVLRLLRESHTPMTSKGVCSQLAAFGLPEEKVAAAWEAARRKFVQNPDIEARGRGGGRTYRWVGEVAETATIGDGGLAKEVASVDTESATAEPPTDHPAPPPKTATEVLTKALGDGHDVREYLRRPLQTAVRLGKLAELPTGKIPQQAVALLLALPRKDDAVDGSELLASVDQATGDALVIAAAAETQKDPDPNPGISAAAAWLLRRASARLGTPATTALIHLTHYLAKSPHPDLEALESANLALARLIPLLPSQLRATLSFDKIAEPLVGLPWTARGARVAVVAAIGRAAPERITDDMWWRQVSLPALVECAEGPLGAVTSLPAVAKHVIGPLVADELSSVTTRKGLAFLLGLPREFAAQLPAVAVADALRRVSADEPIVGEWVRAMSDEGRVKTLEHDLEQARAETATAMALAQESERKVVELAERCDRLEETIRNQHAHAVALRTSQERQAKIDIVRAMAHLAAEVEELAANSTAPQVLVERVRGLVGGAELEPVGAAGTQTAFDPQTQEPLVGAPAAGSPVDVIRPGYWWLPSDEAILISKAVVTVM